VTREVRKSQNEGEESWQISAKRRSGSSGGGVGRERKIEAGRERLWIGTKGKRRVGASCWHFRVGGPGGDAGKKGIFDGETWYASEKEQGRGES